MKLKAVSGIMLTLLLIGVLTLAIKGQPVAAVDWWPMFHHDLSHTGYSTSTAPNTNNVIWSYTTGGRVDSSSPAVVDGKVYVGSTDKKVYAFGPPADKFGLLAPYIVLASTILVVAVATAIYIKRRKKPLPEVTPTPTE